MNSVEFFFLYCSISKKKKKTNSACCLDVSFKFLFVCLFVLFFVFLKNIFSCRYKSIKKKKKSCCHKCDRSNDKEENEFKNELSYVVVIKGFKNKFHKN